MTTRDTLAALAARYDWRLVADPGRSVQPIHETVADQILSAMRAVSLPNPQEPPLSRLWKKVADDAHERIEALTAAIEDIDAHAAPLGQDDDGFVTTGYVISVGSLHRALGIARGAPVDAHERMAVAPATSERPGTVPTTQLGGSEMTDDTRLQDDRRHIDRIAERLSDVCDRLET